MTGEEELAILLDDLKIEEDWSPNELSSSAKHPCSDESLLPYIGPGGQGWPMDKVPIEIFQAIGEYLSRDSLLSFRASCKEFERKTSHLLFRTVVVPFRPELFGKVEASELAETQDKGKGKARVRIGGDSPGLSGGRAEKGGAHNGMDIFKHWGHHISQFGLTFEIDDGKPVSCCSITIHNVYRFNFVFL